MNRILTKIERDLRTIRRDIAEIMHLLGLPVRQDPGSMAEITSEGNGKREAAFARPAPL